jgi:hypothetical protein
LVIHAYGGYAFVDLDAGWVIHPYRGHNSGDLIPGQAIALTVYGTGRGFNGHRARTVHAYTVPAHTSGCRRTILYPQRTRAVEY